MPGYKGSINIRVPRDVEVELEARAKLVKMSKTNYLRELVYEHLRGNDNPSKYVSGFKVGDRLPPKYFSTPNRREQDNKVTLMVMPLHRMVARVSSGSALYLYEIHHELAWRWAETGGAKRPPKLRYNQWDIPDISLSQLRSVSENLYLEDGVTVDKAVYDHFNDKLTIVDYAI